MVPMTREELQKALPEKMKKTINQTLVDQINQTLSEPELYETYRDNLLSYGHVMAEGKFRIEQYLSAVKYVSFKIMGKTNGEAYSLTFPDRIQRHHANNTSDKDIASYVAAYNKSKLVNLVYENSMIPSWVLNQDAYQEAINTQMYLMKTAKSEMVRTTAANSIMTHLKPPETQKHELRIGASEEQISALDAMRKSMATLVSEQRQAIQSGMVTSKDIAHHGVVIEGESEEVVDA